MRYHTSEPEPLLFVAMHWRACVICIDGGAAKIDPAIEAVNMPLPTKPKEVKKILS